MILLEHKIKKFLEDKRNIRDKLSEEFTELNNRDILLRTCGCFTEHSKVKWMQLRSKYRRHRVFNMGVWQVNWKNIEIGKR